MQFFMEAKMKPLLILIFLAGAAYGGKYLYDQGYFDSFIGSVEKTTERTVNFATDKAVKEANF